jgi:hypothetical protein
MKIKSLFFVLQSAVLLLCSCSTSEQQTSSDWKNIPFEGLNVVQIMTGFIPPFVDEGTVRETLIKEFGKIGVVHTPVDTPIEEVIKAEKKPFALVVIRIGEVDVPDLRTGCSVLKVACAMYEESHLKINDKEWMANVWEKTAYIPISDDVSGSTDKVVSIIQSMTDEFRSMYLSANQDQTGISFFLGKSIGQ